jgi:hypothetical protein
MILDNEEARDTPFDWELMMRQYLGDDFFEDLLQAMLDVATAPMDLQFASGPTLIGLRDSAQVRLQNGLSTEDGRLRSAMESALPWYLEGTNLASAVLQLGTSRAYFEIPDSVYDAFPSESRVLDRVSSLAALIDDDGLVDVSGLDARDQGLFLSEWGIHYHQLMRRGFSSNINDTLIKKLLEVAGRSGNVLRLGIDHRRICPRDEFVNFIEEDFWYGPPLTEEWLDDPNKIGRTVHEDPAGEDALRGYRAIFAYWRMASETEKVLQMEELPTRTSMIGGRYLCRYLHAIRDIKRGQFIHCDGAVRMYDATTYDKRIAENMPSGTRANRYRKLFRIDGAVETSEWSDLVVKWFRHNILAGEYVENLSRYEGGS